MPVCEKETNNKSLKSFSKKEQTVNNDGTATGERKLDRPSFNHLKEAELLQFFVFPRNVILILLKDWI